MVDIIFIMIINIMSGVSFGLDLYAATFNLFLKNVCVLVSVTGRRMSLSFSHVVKIDVM